MIRENNEISFVIENSKEKSEPYAMKHRDRPIDTSNFICVCVCTLAYVLYSNHNS